MKYNALLLLISQLIFSSCGSTSRHKNSEEGFLLGADENLNFDNHACLQAGYQNSYTPPFLTNTEVNGKLPRGSNWIKLHEMDMDFRPMNDLSLVKLPVREFEVVDIQAGVAGGESVNVLKITNDNGKTFYFVPQNCINCINLKAEKHWETDNVQCQLYPQ